MKRATDILIAGAGLSGLALAHACHKAGREVLVVEARERAAGRILTRRLGGAAYDLGPAWFWPGQPRVAELARRLGLEVFEQYATGHLVFQDGNGRIRRDIDMAPMAGSLRIAGGMTRLVEGLLADLPAQGALLGHRLSHLARKGDGLRARVESATGPVEIDAGTAVLALPPRIGAGIGFDPALPDDAMAAMRNVPTWMAGHAKVIAVYDTPFWRELGLSGDAISHAGPLAEIHDASPADGSAGALFGFIGVPASARAELHAGTGDALKAASQAQLATLFGARAADPVALHLQDWAVEPETATEADRNAPPTAHPRYGLPLQLGDLWEGRLHFASSEMGESFGGFLEGALEAAEATARKIL
ncbi:MAG: FAD-dependent oxidoreductase [Pseudomonadota bacterium]